MNEEKVRVAVVQLDSRVVRTADTEGLFVDSYLSSAGGAAVRLAASGMPPDDDLLVDLGKRVRGVYLDQLRARLRGVMAACRRLSVNFVVFPPDTIPAELLSIFTSETHADVLVSSHLADDAFLKALHVSRDQREAWRGRIVAPLLSSFLGSVDAQPQLRGHADPWTPLGGRRGIGVVFASDIAGREHDRWRTSIAPNVDACRLIVVLQDVPTSEFPELATLAAAPPILVVSPAVTGGSCVLARDEPRSPDDTLHITALEPGEEGLLVYDLKLPGTDSTATATRSLVAAASFVYRAHPVISDYAEWSTKFSTDHSMGFDYPRDTSVRNLLGEVAAARDLLLQVIALDDAPTRTRRLHHLLEHYREVTRATTLHALTFEVVLPDECISPADLRDALALAVRQQVDQWLHDPGFTADRPAQSDDLRLPTFGEWSSRGQKALRDIRRQILDDGPRLVFVPLPDRTLDESLLWLELSGAMDLRVIRMDRDDAAAAPPGILGRLGERWHLWTSTADMDSTLVDAVAALDIVAAHALLDLPAMRLRLPELLRPFESVYTRIIADRDQRLRDVHGYYEPLQATQDNLTGSYAALDLLEMWADSDDAIALLLGSPGTGKTTLVHEWAVRRWSAARRPLPLPVNSSFPSVGALDLLTTILRQSGRPDTAQERAALQLLLHHELLVPCFDAFDEAPRQAELAFALLALATRFRLVVVSRPSPDLEAQLRVRQPPLPTRTIRLELFSSDQVVALVTRVHKTIGDTRDALRRIAGIYDLADLVRQPLLLGMVLQTLDRLDPTTHIELIDLHDAYLRRWLDTIERRDAALAFVEALALALWAGNAKTYAFDELQRTPWHALLVGRPPAPGPFLIEDGDTYGFAHQSFHDFFLARALLAHLPTYPLELLAVGFPAPPVFELLVQQVRRTDHSRGRFIVALQFLLTSGPSLDRKRYSECAGPAALYLHFLGRALDPNRQWIPRGADLGGPNFAGVNFTGQDLRGAKLAGLELSSAILTRADLTGADLRGSSLVAAFISEARLDGADLREVDARNAKFHHTEADRCDLRGANFRGADLGGSTWTECRWDDAQLDADPYAAWLNLGGSGTALGQALPRAWRLHATSNQRPRFAWRLAWAPDGRHLAFEISGRTGIIDCLSGQVHFLASITYAFSWAHTSPRFAYIDASWNVHVGRLGEPPAAIPFDTGGVPVFNVTWRPDDDHLVLATRDGIELASDGGQRTLLHPFAQVRSDPQRPLVVWSSRGSVLVRDFSGDLHLLPASFDSSLQIGRTHGSGDPRLSSTGEFLVQRDIIRTQVHDLRTDPPEAFRLTTDDDPRHFAWKPGGSLLTYVRDPGVLVTYDAERRQAVREQWLTRGNYDGVAWSPVGDRLALIANNTCLQVCRPDGDPSFELFVTGKEHALWAPGGYVSLGDPTGREIGLSATIGDFSYSFPLAGLHRVLHRPTAVCRAIAGEDPGPPGEHLLDALGWHSPPSPATAPQTAGTRLTPNRFRPGAPYDDSNLPGRDDILRELTGLLDAASPALLKGPRRAGKTSILHTLQARHRGGRTVVRRTLEGLWPVTPDDLAVILDPGLRDRPEPARALREHLESAARPPILMLDELAWLGRASDELFGWLRTLSQERLAAIVLAGSHGDWNALTRLANRTPGSSFGNDYTIVELGPIPEDRAIAFLVETAPADVPIDPQRAAKWIVELCDGWPFYLQVMGYHLIEEVRSGRRGLLDIRHELRALYERRLLQGRDAVFRSRWSDLQRPAQLLLLELFAEARRDNFGDLPPHREQTRSARKILSDADLLDVSAGWKIDPPMRDWLHRNLDELEPHDG